VLAGTTIFFSPSLYGADLSRKRNYTSLPFNAHYPEEMAPDVDEDAYKLIVDGLVENKHPWTLDQLYALPQETQYERAVRRADCRHRPARTIARGPSGGGRGNRHRSCGDPPHLSRRGEDPNVTAWGAGIWRGTYFLRTPESLPKKLSDYAVACPVGRHDERS
jgi:hypothetical protein